EGMASMELVGTERGHQRDLRVLDVPGEEGQQVERGSIGPVQVLHDDDDTTVLREAAEELQEALVQSALAAAACPQHRVGPEGTPAQAGDDRGDIRPGVPDELLEGDRAERARQV